VVEEPVAFGIGFAVLVLVAYTGAPADSLVTVAHEGGHMLTLLLTGYGVKRFTLDDKGDRVNGETTPAEKEGWLSNVIVASPAIRYRRWPGWLARTSSRTATRGVCSGSASCC
jgi:Peptidase M50B-like